MPATAAPRFPRLASLVLTTIDAPRPSERRQQPVTACHADAHDTLDVRIARAAQKCAAAGAKLTDIRRQVLTLILDSEEPVGAYHLLDRLKSDKANATPNTVYRALEFLRDQGLVHRLERLNAFVGCVDGGEHAHHAAQFLICVQCGAVTELGGSWHLPRGRRRRRRRRVHAPPRHGGSGRTLRRLPRSCVGAIDLYPTFCKHHARTRTWLGREGSNLRMAESKSAALPLGDAPAQTLNRAASGRS